MSLTQVDWPVSTTFELSSLKQRHSRACTQNQLSVIPLWLVSCLSVFKLPAGKVALVARYGSQGASVTILTSPIDADCSYHRISKGLCRGLGIA
jgi:hypothetical protein